MLGLLPVSGMHCFFFLDIDTELLLQNNCKVV